MHIFHVRYATIVEWFNKWEREASVGIKPGRGRKQKLGHVPPALLEQLLAIHGRNLKAVVAWLAAELEVKSGFSLTSSLPRAWQKKGRTLGLLPGQGKRLKCGRVLLFRWWSGLPHAAAAGSVL